MLDTLRKRLRSEKGFTLIELLVVMIILAILMAVAIPSYLSFRDRANKSAAGADLRAVIPDVEAWFSDHGTYAGMTPALLKASYDQSINTSIYTITSLGGDHVLRPGQVPERRDEDGCQEGPVCSDRHRPDSP